MAIDLKPAPRPEAAKGGASAAAAASAAPATSRFNPVLFGGGRIGLPERMVFTERLALLLQTGVSLLEALHVMQSQTEQPQVAAVIAALAQTISEGKRFSAALSLHPEMFNGPYISLVAAAEEGGFLAEVLDQLQQMDDKSIQLRSTLVSTLSYPAFLIVFSVAVVIFVLVVIFPKFEDLFSSIRKDLPATTIALIALSNFLRAYWVYVLGALGAAAWGVVQWSRSAAGRLSMDGIKTRLPVVGELYVKAALIQFLSVLGLSLSNGVPITVALRACRDVVDNSVFQHFIDTVRAHVNEGRGVAIGFRQADFIPPMVKQMIATGDDTGNLGMVMTRIAVFYEKDIQKRVQIISKTVEPVMLLVMGLVVGVIVASLILPIFKLSRAAG